jgi:hypothetical protein
VIGEHPETISKSENTVITVFSVETLLQDSDMRESLFTESDYYFAASFPGSWQRVLSPDGLLQYAPEGADAVVSVRLVDENSEQGEDYETSIQEWSLVNVGGKSGYQQIQSGGNVTMLIPFSEEEEFVVFEFTAQQNPNLEKVAFYKMLTGLRWLESEEEQVINDSPEAIVYCGGVAKKLCPSGFRCELSSFEDNATGICVDASMPPQDISGFLVEAEEEILRQEARDDESAREDSEEFVTVTIPDSWTEYRRERLSYSFAIPSSWWWEERGGTELVSRVVIAEEEITDTNQIIFLEILPYPVDRRIENESGSEFTVAIPRDDSTSFLVRGENKYSEQIEKIASSLSLF